MSLIHEALKKAEAQRHLGEAPTLNTPSFARRRQRRWMLPIVVLAIILAGGYLAWSFWPAAHVNASSHGAATLPPAAPTGASAHRTAGAPPSAESAEPTSAAPKGPSRKSSASSTPLPTRRSLPQQRSAATQAVARQQQKRPQPQPTHVTPRSAITTQAPVAPPPTVALKPLPKASAAKPMAAAAAPASASTNALPLYWQLPYAERKDLPELNISMHVYAADPEDRFVIINGVRQVEGDDLGTGMTLVAIRRDGIVVELKGKQFIVPTTHG